MSLNIDSDKIEAVLLVDGWYEINPGSFDLDAYEFRDGSVHPIHGGGQSGVCATGFRVRVGNSVIMGR
jgi:hypothetical protein